MFDNKRSIALNIRRNIHMILEIVLAGEVLMLQVYQVVEFVERPS